jgi:hypothetical protein
MITYKPLSDKFLTIATVKTKNGQKDVRIVLDIDNNVFYTLDDDGNFLPIVSGVDDDIYTTGFTYSNNTFTISQNSGTSLSAIINSVTGLTVNGILSAQTTELNFKSITSDYSATTSDNKLGVDTTLNPINIYLPQSSSTPKIFYDIKDIGLQSEIKNIIINAFGTDKIISFEESSSIIIDINGTSLTLYNNGGGKWIII